MGLGKISRGCAWVQTRRLYLYMTERLVSLTARPHITPTHSLPCVRECESKSEFLCRRTAILSRLVVRGVHSEMLTPLIDPSALIAIGYRERARLAEWAMTVSREFEPYLFEGSFWLGWAYRCTLSREEDFQRSQVKFNTGTHTLYSHCRKFSNISSERAAESCLDIYLFRLCPLSESTVLKNTEYYKLNRQTST